MYTDEQLDDIDALVERFVFGQGDSVVRLDGRGKSGWFIRTATSHADIPDYTRSGDAMLMVVEKMRELGKQRLFAKDKTNGPIGFSLFRDGDRDGEQYVCTFVQCDDSFSFEAETPQLATCLAALAAVGHPHTKENARG